MAKSICIKRIEKTAKNLKDGEICYGNNMYSKSQDQLVKSFNALIRPSTDSDYKISAICLDTEAGYKLCSDFLGIIPSATIEYADYLTI